MNLESPKVNVSKSTQYLFDALSEVKNFEKLMPDTITKFEVISESFGATGVSIKVITLNPLDLGPSIEFPMADTE